MVDMEAIVEVKESASHWPGVDDGGVGEGDGGLVGREDGSPRVCLMDCVTRASWLSVAFSWVESSFPILFCRAVSWVFNAAVELEMVCDER